MTKTPHSLTHFFKTCVLLILFLGGFVPSLSLGQAPIVVGKDVEVKDVGRGAAGRYFERNESNSSSRRGGSGENVLYIMAGPYTSSASYAWKGSDKRTGIAKNSYCFTYLFEQWHNIDMNIRGDFTDFVIDDEKLLKFSVMPLWTFPLVETRFPLYFGLGAGLGVFFKQVDQESNISFDYQLVVGTRFLEILGNAGAVIEFGMKNHVHILSDGQLNATALTVGTVFSF